MEAMMQTDATSWEIHSLLASDCVEGTPVRSTEGTMIGTIERVIIDKASGNVSCAVLSLNGSVHIGRKRLAIPWHGLTYDRTTASYNLDLAENDLIALCRASGVEPGNRGGKRERAENRRKADWGIAETW
jgi:PRC-barrel domain